ncbi:MAG TPA: GTP cyclohydrolase I FolE [Nitrobacter sp.]|nr:GTP cyclohydrolase I FolE [Nitrobacter sp.]
MEFTEFDIALVSSRDVETDEAHPPKSPVEQAVRTLIRAAGDDPDREGLRDTPARVARAYGEWFAGYAVDPKALLQRVFTDAEGYEETVLLRDIPFVSTCEHHLAPIMGKAHVAYRPNGRVVGISKLSRLVDAFARRLQLQERLTNQVARAIDEVLQPSGVAVIIEASHGCMTTRGVNQHGVSMVTKCWLGDFKTDPDLRRELMESVRRCAQ